MSAKKPTSDKNCAYCGIKLERKISPVNGTTENSFKFNRRKYCDYKCMAEAMDAKPSEGTDRSTFSYHARKLLPPSLCEDCGVAEGKEVHHCDSDWTNNDMSNLARLCRGCHRKRHHPKTFCKICGEPVLSLGYCGKHYRAFKKYGDPNAVKVRVKTEDGYKWILTYGYQ